jgi:hypothetical protein
MSPRPTTVCRVEETRAVIPMRPLTLGELLDAAVGLLRANAALLLVSAFVLATLEQTLLLPLRMLNDVLPPSSLPREDIFTGPYVLIFCLGLTTEAAVLALLGGLTGAAAGPGLLGRRVPPLELLVQALRRGPALLVVALLTALLVLPSALVVLLPWPLVYGLVGLAGPALVVDRIGPFRAIGRSMKLAGVGLRGVGVRLAAFVSWAAIRMALGFGLAALLEVWLRQEEAGYPYAMTAVWILVNTVAYAMLASIDAVLYLEVRMRVEGLDVAIGRLRRLDRPVDLASSVILGAAVR